MKQVVKVFKGLYIWEISIIVALLLMVAGFTGEIPFLDMELEPGMDQQAITSGAIFFLVGINLKLVSMLIEKRAKNE